jgi:hypothetical protein
MSGKETKIDYQFNPAIEQKLLGDKSKEIEGKKADIFKKIEEVYTRQTNDRQSFGKQSVLLQNVLDAYRGLKVIYDKEDSENLRTRVLELQAKMKAAEDEKNAANAEKDKAVAAANAEKDEAVKQQKTSQFEYIDSFCNEILQKLNALDEDNKKNEAEVDAEIKKLEEENSKAWFFQGKTKIDRAEIKRRKDKAPLEKIIASETATDEAKDKAREQLKVLEGGTLEEIAAEVKQINKELSEISRKPEVMREVVEKGVQNFDVNKPKKGKNDDALISELDKKLLEERNVAFGKSNLPRRPAEVGGGKRKTKRRRSRNKSKKSRNRRH